MLPLFIEENVLAVAMAEPDNVMLQDNLRVMTQKEIQPFVATKTQIIKAIDDFYQGGGSTVIQKTMESGEQQAAGGDDIEEVPDSDQKLDLDQAVSGAREAQVVSYVNAILKQAIAERC